MIVVSLISEAERSKGKRTRCLVGDLEGSEPYLTLANRQHALRTVKVRLIIILGGGGLPLTTPDPSAAKDWGLRLSPPPTPHPRGMFQTSFCCS